MTKIVNTNSQITYQMSTTQRAGTLLATRFREMREGSIVTGTIQEIRPQVVLVDIGYKSEGAYFHFRV